MQQSMEMEHHMGTDHHRVIEELSARVCQGVSGCVRKCQGASGRVSAHDSTRTRTVLTIVLEPEPVLTIVLDPGAESGPGNIDPGCDMLPRYAPGPDTILAPIQSWLGTSIGVPARELGLPLLSMLHRGAVLEGGHSLVGTRVSRLGS